MIMRNLIKKILRESDDLQWELRMLRWTYTSPLPKILHRYGTFS